MHSNKGLKGSLLPTARIKVGKSALYAALAQTASEHIEGLADWQFTTADARVKLARLYPQFA